MLSDRTGFLIISRKEGLVGNADSRISKVKTNPFAVKGQVKTIRSIYKLGKVSRAQLNMLCEFFLH